MLRRRRCCVAYRAQNEISGLASDVAELDRRMKRPLERYRGAGRHVVRRNGKDEHAERLDADALTRRADEGLIVGCEAVRWPRRPARRLPSPR